MPKELAFVPELLHDSPGLRVEGSAGPSKTTLRYIGTATPAAHFKIDGLELPLRMNSCSQGEPRAMRLGPGEWLGIGWPCPLAGRLDPALFAVDVSDGLVCFDVGGPLARALLAAASSADFDPDAFGPGTAMRTRFARASAIVECRGPEHFVLYVDRSHSHYAAAWLALNAPRVAAAG